VRDKNGKGIGISILDKKVLKNHKRYLERKKLYRDFGINTDRERDFVLEKTGPIFGDILEVGTGKGYFTLVLAQQGRRFTSVDISAEEQAKARLNLKYFKLENLVDFRIENAERLSFANNSFDTIFSINTVHHFTNPFKVMDELLRVVSPEGKIILSDFSREGLRILDKVHSSEGRIHKTSEFDLKQMEAYLKRKDLDVEKHPGRFQEMLIAYKPLLQ